jgi:hypothetical protein
MSFFKRFPYIADYKIGGTPTTGIDLTRRTKISEKNKNDESLFIYYDVMDGETPEMIADRVYEDPSLYWVILLFNEIFDIDEHWPLSNYDLNNYVDRKYDDPFDTHHYESAATGAIVDFDHVAYDRIKVTNKEYEIRLNDDKRRVKIPAPEFVPNIVDAHNQLIEK